MSPQSTALPPPQVEIIDRWYGPYLGIAEFATFGGNLGTQMKVRYGLNNLQINTGTVGAVGGAGVVFTIENSDNRIAFRALTTAAANAGGWYPPITSPSMGPASGFNPGAQLGAGSVVQVYNTHFRLSTGVTATAGWTDDFTGFYFCPDRFGVQGVNDTRGGASAQPGFGIFFNDAAGAIQATYVAWDNNADLERLGIGASIIPDLTDWSTIRTVLISSANGREATMSLQVNGFTILTGGRTFGTASLARPDAQDAFAIRWAWMRSQSATASGEFMDWTWDGWTGRFTPGGEEIQPLTA